ncbi:MAG: Tat pathway signal sequence domain protein [Armatimonadetes bacterium]|nr:Tat pathway signal sequence domain protein [Armatimonadota bacterium]
MSSLSRREFMKQTALAVVAAQVPLAQAQSGGTQAAARGKTLVKPAQLRWLEGQTPAFSAGVTWGVPWPLGAIRRDQNFVLRDERGQNVPLQSWPLAFWPDGSLKWSAHAARPTSGTSFSLAPSATPATSASGALKTSQSARSIVVDTGLMRCEIPKSGASIVSTLERGGKVVGRDAQLVCLVQNGAATTEYGATEPQKCVSEITRTVLEHSGPLRAVVRVEGKHRAPNGRQWLPFVLRFTFYAGGEAVRVMHSFVFDGNENQDFIRGLGLSFSVPLRDQLHDRHVRFGGPERGLWAEAVRGLTGLRRDPGENVRKAQIEGVPTPPVSQWASSVSSRLELIPAWGDFTLSQLSADGFQIRKRTKSGHAWIPAGNGRRAVGVGYVGGISGGMAFGMRDFWQKHPVQLDIRGAHTDSATVTIWLYAPDAPAMDLRFYHDGLGMDTFAKQREGLEITYEDYEPGFGTPYGVARTSEMWLWACDATPPREKTADFAALVRTPPLLVAAPQQFLDARVFGALWSLPDRSTPAKIQIENQLDYLLDLFPKQVEKQSWYGFWDYGDVMHSYDSDRHVWKYDIGGFAWANGELSPQLWLWYSFLRSGRADIFRFAEAMTRHTSEVDVHHIGRFAGLGARHNVQHWGDSSKQTRVSNAAFHRIYYFLTADERTGDLMHDLIDSDIAVSQIDVGRKLGADADARKAVKREPGMGFGTDWMSVVAAWLTEWERTGNPRYRDKIINGMRSIGAMKRGWLGGWAQYDAATGNFTSNPDNIGLSHLSAVFGAVEINAEIIELFDVPEYKRAWIQYCELYNAPAAVQIAQTGQEFKKLNLREAHSRLTAYAAQQKNDPQLAARAWEEFYEGGAGLGVRTDFTPRAVTGPWALHPTEDAFGASTNAASQWGLAAIQNLALIGHYLPPNPKPRGGRNEK